MIPKLTKEDRSLIDSVFEELLEKYGLREDPWGLNLKRARKNLNYIYPLYKNYFKVRLFGKENVQDKQYMVISNHSGQIAIDGLLIGTAFALEVSPARILRPMVERFFTSLPFINKWASECGSVLGDRENCMNLLERGESLLIFPEGVRGVAKSTKDYYKVQEFTRGFYRMAIKAGIEILPLAVVGAEEVFPYVYQAKGVAKKFGLPALPLSANYFPLPSPVDIYIGEPITPDSSISSDPSDSEIDPLIDEIEVKIQHMIDEGLKQRREFWAIKEENKGVSSES
ncbi:lysophospholipid acyltransferase family protein [Bacteriovorax sp. DB6_IX]|uniref:lysophospholipid acyltransferase family protein n=1 Tax=Bacteriovorax sp. DB6_IX TaxID=1353530 RepID=UPI00038A1925|nr:lysophospholipid acyltransferase family protein [Bacteriovorax sp. DB6_IX]EQC46286.1 diacylglycerol acyltransferase [Bacteriovorax sp. DB6_IX]